MSTVDSWYTFVWRTKITSPVLRNDTNVIDISLNKVKGNIYWCERPNIYFIFQTLRPLEVRRFFRPTKSDFDIFQFWLRIFPMNLVVLAHKIFKVRFTYLFWYLYFWEYIEMMWQIPPNIDENKRYEEVFVITC